MRLIKKLDLTTRKFNELEKRIAARGIAIKDNEVLMVYIKKDDTYSFPGGGVEFGESFEEACIREMREETGARGTEIISEFGYVDEYRDSKYHTDKAFNMISYYYLCKISDLNGNIKLEDYERELGFEAVWIDISEALNHNKNIIEDIVFSTKKRRYLHRSIFVLEELERGL
ncbi:NUDIX domain-containing protein [Mycoplasmatota bacterium WC44]